MPGGAPGARRGVVTDSAALFSFGSLAHQRDNGPDALHHGNLIDLELKPELLLERENQVHLLERIPGGNRVGRRFETHRRPRNPEGARHNFENAPLDLIHDLNPVR
jgi:hypothetical protein